MVRTFDFFDNFAKVTIQNAPDKFDFFDNFDSAPAGKDG